MPPTSGIAAGSFTIPTIGETSANVWYRIHALGDRFRRADHESLPRRPSGNQQLHGRCQYWRRPDPGRRPTENDAASDHRRRQRRADADGTGRVDAKRASSAVSSSGSMVRRTEHAHHRDARRGHGVRRPLRERSISVAFLVGPRRRRTIRRPTVGARSSTTRATARRRPATASRCRSAASATRKGLGVHAASDVRYHLGGSFSGSSPMWASMTKLAMAARLCFKFTATATCCLIAAFEPATTPRGSRCVST